MEDTNLTCPTKNCNLRFTSESHLKNHKKKHEMVLTLNKNNISSTDQTPTPTRFIRNCEEIGLFQDLQINPFEETFRKAAESVKKGIPIRQETQFLSKAAGDDLHTPHLFPEVQEEITIIENHVTEEVVVRSEADTSLKTLTPQPSPPMDDDDPKTSTSNTDDPVQVILRMPNGALFQLSTKPLQTFAVNETISIAPTVKANGGGTVILTTGQDRYQDISPKKQNISPNPNPDVKEKLKAFLGGTAKAPSSFGKLDISKSGASSKSKVKRSYSPNLKKTFETIDDVDKEKREKILQRNREAAYRCRAKRKKWVEELARRADQMATANRALVQEVSTLRDEVSRLKGLLLAHAHCPVTLAANSRLETFAVTTMEKNIPIRDKLTLNLERAAENTIMDLDSPSLVVKKDEVLTSVAPPSTPDERIVTFPDLDREDITESLEDKLSSSIGTTVIQINPNVLKSHSFS